MEETISHLQKKVSASRLTLFLQCRLKFYFRYVLKLTKPKTAALHFGSVGIGAIPNGFGIEVELKVSLPGMAPEAARALVDKAHVVCPYSNATRNNIDVRLTLA